MNRCHNTHADQSAASAKRWSLNASRSVTGAPAGRVEFVRGLLEEAHAQLGPRELAEVLLAARGVLEPLRLGRALARPPEALPRVSDLSPGARVYVRPIHVHLARWSRGADQHTRRALFADLDLLVHDLAALPRGACVTSEIS